MKLNEGEINEENLNTKS